MFCTRGEMNPHLGFSLKWALVSIPISLIGVVLSFGLVHSGGPLLILYVPFIVFMGGLEYFGVEMPNWLWSTLGLTVQYVGYFLLIFVVRLAYAHFRRRT